MSAIYPHKEKRPYLRVSPGPFAVAALVLLLGTGCAFLNQVVDRSNFDLAEMKFDVILPDRDLPDITSTIVSEWGAGAGGGAVGGCWSCG